MFVDFYLSRHNIVFKYQSYITYWHLQQGQHITIFVIDYIIALIYVALGE
jgi:hypothetical protein